MFELVCFLKSKISHRTLRSWNIGKATGDLYERSPPRLMSTDLHGRRQKFRKWFNRDQHEFVGLYDDFMIL